MNRRSGLGKGLSALIPPPPDEPASEGEAAIHHEAGITQDRPLSPASMGLDATQPQQTVSTPPPQPDGVGALVVRELALDALDPNPHQPRDVFEPAELEGLAASLREVGVLQPVLVRPRDTGRYELVAGERRVRAARLAGMDSIPAIVRRTDDPDVLKQAVIENIHRVQLNPLEEAAAFDQLLQEFGFTQEELAKRLGKGRPTITNALRLLHLAPGVQRSVAAGVLSAGHAKVLLAVEDATAQERIADQVIAEGLSVRATEGLVRREAEADSPPPAGPRPRPDPPQDVVRLQDELGDALGTRVRISLGARRGKLQIDLGSVDDLDRVVAVIARGLERQAGIGSAPDLGSG